MKPISALILPVFFVNLTLSPLCADPRDKRTSITLETPLRVPTMRLQPGTYTLKLMESASSGRIVTVWDQDGTKLLTTFTAIPIYRTQPTSDSTFTFWEATANQPRVLSSWFYPGDTIGQKFVYPNKMTDEETMLADKAVAVPNGGNKPLFGGTSSQVSAVENVARIQQKSSVVVQAKTEPKVAAFEQLPSAVAATTTEVSQERAPAAVPIELPATANPWWELLLIGAGMMFAGLSTFFGNKEDPF
jgi:hypothetical protein